MFDILFGVGSWDLSGKRVSVNPDTTSATGGEDGTTVDVIIDTNVTMTADYVGTGVLSGDCEIDIGPVAVRYQGTVELDITGSSIGGEVELSHIIVGDPSSSTSWGSGCSTGIVDAIASYLGYDIVTTFIDSDFENLVQDLGDRIEDDLIEYDIPTACGEEIGSGSSTLGMCDDSCTFAMDGECDDGGPDSDTSVCDLGTDCSDCGPR